MRRNLVRLLTIVVVLALIVIGLNMFTSIFDNVTEMDNSDDDSETDALDSFPPDDFNDIVILGDSIGSGIGDEEKSGIGERYLDLIDNDNVTVSNLAVSGYTSNQLVELIENGENDSIISEAELIIISIGGNDLNRLAFQRNLDLPTAFEETLENYTVNLQTMASELSELNPEAELALIGLYNPYKEIVPEITSYLLEWNEETQTVVESNPNFSYIPTYDLFENNLNDYLYVDYFHPNEEGYQVIANQIYEILN